MTITDEQTVQSSNTTVPYRDLDSSKNEIRLLSSENTPQFTPVQLKLHYVSLNDLRPEYVSFRDQNASTSSAQLSGAWSDGIKFTLATPQREIYTQLEGLLGVITPA